jgi:hypothetical protein
MTKLDEAAKAAIAATPLTALQDRVRVLEEKLRPFAACVYNDNGAVTYDKSGLTNDAFWDAYVVLKRASLATASSPSSETVAEQLYEALKHGDDIHRAWLREAIIAFFAGQPIPPPRVAPTPQTEPRREG